MQFFKILSNLETILRNFVFTLVFCQLVHKNQQAFYKIYLGLIIIVQLYKQWSTNLTLINSYGYCTSEYKLTPKHITKC